MFEKDVTVGYLNDFYGELLTERARRITSQYYCDDLSLSEIAENEGISRQGVRATLKRAEEQLRFFEEKLGLAAQFAGIRTSAGEIGRLAASLSASDDPSTRDAAKEIGDAAERIISLF